MNAAKYLKAAGFVTPAQFKALDRMLYGKPVKVPTIEELIALTGEKIKSGTRSTVIKTYLYNLGVYRF